MQFDYRKVTVEICQGELDCIKAVICFAFDHRGRLKELLDERFDARLDIADGIYHALKHAYKKCLPDGHEQVEAWEYAAAEHAFAARQREKVLTHVSGGALCVIDAAGEDHYAFCDPVHDSRGWVDIPDLIGRAALEAHERQQGG